MVRALNKNEILATDNKVLSAVDTYFAKLKTVSIAGTAYTPKALKQVFQDEVIATQALDRSRAQLTEQMTRVITVREKADATRKGLKAFILGSYGKAAAQMLSDFGFAPKAGVQTVEVKAQAVAKAKATRKARNTMGKRQKELVRGSVDTSSTAPVTTPAAPIVTPANLPS